MPVRRSKWNKKCDNPLCTNQVIRISEKSDKQYCKVCSRAVIIGYRKAYNLRRKQWKVLEL